MMFVCVALTRGRVIPSSLPTATAMEQPRTLIPLPEVTPSLRFSRKIHKKIEILNPLKLKSGTLGIQMLGGGHLVQDAQGVRKTFDSRDDVLLRKRA